MSAACAEAFEQFLQAAPKISPVSTVREIHTFDKNLDAIENILLSSTADQKWQMQHAADLLFFIIFLIFLLLSTLQTVANNIDARQALREDRFAVPKLFIFEGYIILQAWALNAKAGAAFALLFSIKYLYKFVTTRREQEDVDADAEEAFDELFEHLLLDFWRPILVCLIFSNLYERYAGSYSQDTSSERSLIGFVRIVTWRVWNDGDWNWLSVGQLVICILEILYFCPAQHLPLGEGLHFLIDLTWEEIEERALRYIHAIGRIIDRLRGTEAANEAPRMGEHLEGFHAEVDRNLLGEDLLDFGH
jgi:hypothetical protein